MYYCWLNGEIMPASEARLGITDLGLLRGYGIFDYFRTYNGIPFQWDSYWRRFENSAHKMGIDIPISKKESYEHVLTLLQKSEQEDIAIRFVLTGGYSADALNSAAANFIIIAEEIHPVSDSEYINGIKIITAQYVRDVPDIKTLDYKYLLSHRPEILARGASDVLFVKDGIISEMSRSNVFMVKDGKLITPEHNILHGITRKTLLELVKGMYEVEIRDITLEQFLSADELFTTSSTKKVLGITAIDDVKIGDGKSGKVTLELLSLFNKTLQ